jgi:hypothetical protein
LDQGNCEIEIIDLKSEARNPKQILNPNFKFQNYFLFWSFDIVSDFDIRIADLTINQRGIEWIYTR